MAIFSGQLTVGTAATVIPKTCVMPWTLELHNDDNSDEIYIGPEGVTTTTGMQLNKLERLELSLAPLDYLYAVSTKAGHELSWIAFTRAC